MAWDYADSLTTAVCKLFDDDTMSGCPQWREKPPEREACLNCDWCIAFCQDCENRDTCTIYDKSKISPLSREFIRLHNICKEYGQLPEAGGVRAQRRYHLQMLSNVIRTSAQEEENRKRRLMRGNG